MTKPAQAISEHDSEDDRASPIVHNAADFFVGAANLNQNSGAKRALFYGREASERGSMCSVNSIQLIDAGKEGKMSKLSIAKMAAKNIHSKGIEA